MPSCRPSTWLRDGGWVQPDPSRERRARVARDPGYTSTPTALRAIGLDLTGKHLASVGYTMVKTSVAQPTLRVAVAKAPSGAVLLVRERDSVSFMGSLIDAGYRVVLVESAKSLVEEAMKGSFDVVLCDGVLPGAADALSVVQTYERDVPVILLMPANAQTKVDPNLSLFARLEEPVASKDLITAVSRAVDVRRQRQEVEVERTLARIGTAEGDEEEFGTRPTEPVMYRAISGARPKVGVQTNTAEIAFAIMRLEIEPIYDVQELRTVAYEARFRWNEPPAGIHPAILRTAMKEDPLVRRHARKLAADKLAELPIGVELFIDVLPTDLMDAELYAPASPLSRLADRVVLQLRGLGGMTMAELGPRISVLRFLGFRIAMADIDTGAAGLSQLGDLAPEYLKVSISLTRGLDREPVRKRMVEGLVAMCRVIGTTPIAEGEVTPRERAALLEVGCSLVQGKSLEPLRSTA